MTRGAWMVLAVVLAASTPIQDAIASTTTAPADVLVRRVRADWDRIGEMMDRGILEAGPGENRVIELVWGNDIVHPSEFIDSDGQLVPTSRVWPVVNKSGTVHSLAWVGFFVDGVQRRVYDEATGQWSLDPEQPFDSPGLVTGAHDDAGNPIAVPYMTIGVIAPDASVASDLWVLEGSPLEGQESILPWAWTCESSAGTLVDCWQFAFSALSTVDGDTHTVKVDEAQHTDGLIAALEPVAAITALTAMGNSLTVIFERVAKELDDAVDGDQLPGEGDSCTDQCEEGLICSANGVCVVPQCTDDADCSDIEVCMDCGNNTVQCAPQICEWGTCVDPGLICQL